MAANSTVTERKSLKEASPYTAVLTREQFLFAETKTTARLLADGASGDEALERIFAQNLFQYPTERSLRSIARACVRRLEAMQNPGLVRAICEESGDCARQICLYAMMRQYRLVWDFMTEVIADKYRKLDSSFSKSEIDGFFLRLKSKDPWVASWSDKTFAKLSQVLVRMLAESGFIDGIRAETLNNVIVFDVLEEALRKDCPEALSAFGIFV